MSTLYITEYKRLAETSTGNPPIPEEPPVAEQTVSYTGTAGVSATLNVATKFVRLTSDGTMSVAFGTNPTAVTTQRRMKADTVEYFGVSAGAIGSGVKISAVTNT